MFGVEFSSDGSKIYSSNDFNNGIYELTLSNSQFNFTTGSINYSRSHLELATDGFLYAASNDGTNLGKFDIATNSLSSTIPINVHSTASWIPTHGGYSLPDQIDGENYTQYLTVCPDIWMKDSPDDLGIEPNLVNKNAWLSDDIWVTNDDKPFSDNVDDNVPAKKTGLPNYVHVRVRNRGTSPASGRVRVYWAKASTGLSWPTQWTGSETGDHPHEYWPTEPAYAKCRTQKGLPIQFGGEIEYGTIKMVNNLPPGQTDVIHFKWNDEDIPEPQFFGCFEKEDAGHFCLLARIETEENTPYGMTYPEGNNLVTNVLNNNNIAWKNIRITSDLVYKMAPLPPFPPTQIIVRNIKHNTALMSFQFRVPVQELQDPFTNHGSIYVNMGVPLFTRWFNNGLQGYGFQITNDTTINIVDTVAEFKNIPFDSLEADYIGVYFKLNPNETFSQNKSFNFDVIQFTDSSSVPDGGVRCELRIEGKLNTVQSMSFDTTVTFGTSVDSFYVSNTGGADLSISSVTSSNGEFTISPTNDIVINSGDSAKFYIAFLPGSGGLKTSSVSFVSNSRTSPDTLVVTGFGLDSNYFRTLSGDTSLARTPSKLVLKKVGKVPNVTTVVVGTPNTGTILQNVYKKFPKGQGVTLGIPQANKDSVKKYAWIQYLKAADLQKLYGKIHTGSAYPLDSLRKSGVKAKALTKAIKADSKTYNNRLWEQAIAFKLNLDASKDTITPYGFHNLVLDIDASLAGKQLKGINLSAIGHWLDTVLTYWRRYPSMDTVSLGMFTENVLRPINTVFATALDSSNYLINKDNIKKNPYDVKLKGFKTASEVGLVKRIENVKEDGESRTFFSDETPLQFSLEQNYPNPFNPITVIRYQLIVNSSVSLKIYNVLGQEVATLLNNEKMDEGMHEVEFDASKLSSGVYFYRIDVNNGKFIQTKKLVLMK